MNWKSISFALLIIIVFLSESYAQRTQSETHIMHIGAHAGWLIKDFDNDTELGANWNAYAEFPLSKKWSMTVGVGFVDLGMQPHLLDITDATGITVTGADIRIFRSGTFNYKYMTFPLLVNLKLNRFYISTGVIPHVYFDHLVRYNNSFVFVPRGETIEALAPTDLRTPNIAYSLGFGYRINIGELISLYLEPRWNTFLMSIYKEPIDGIARNSFSINIGIRKTLLIKRDVTQKEPMTK